MEKTSQPAKKTPRVPLPAAIIEHLRSAGQMLTTEEIYTRLSVGREVPRSHLYSALHRLKKRGKAFKAGDEWGLAGSR